MKNILLIFNFFFIAIFQGCALQDNYPGKLKSEVFSGVVKVAQDPEYMHINPSRRWIVNSNSVSVDESKSQVEVVRRVERILRRTGSKDLYELRKYHFVVEVVDSDPVVVLYKELDPSIPIKVQREADRFFRQLRKYLSMPAGKDFILDETTLPLDDMTDSNELIKDEKTDINTIIPPSF